MGNSAGTFDLPTDIQNTSTASEVAFYHQKSDGIAKDAGVQRLIKIQEDDIRKHLGKNLESRSSGPEERTFAGDSPAAAMTHRKASISPPEVLSTVTSLSLANENPSSAVEHARLPQSDLIDVPREYDTQKGVANESHHFERVKTSKDSSDDLSMGHADDAARDHIQPVDSLNPGDHAEFTPDLLGAVYETPTMLINANASAEPLYAVVRKPHRGNSSLKPSNSADSLKDEAISAKHDLDPGNERVDSDSNHRAGYDQTPVGIDSLDGRTNVVDSQKDLDAVVESDAGNLPYDAEHSVATVVGTDTLPDSDDPASHLGLLSTPSSSSASTEESELRAARLGKESNHTRLVLARVYKLQKTLGISISGGRGSEEQPDIRIENIFTDGAAANCDLLKRGQLLISVDADSLADVSHEEAVIIIRRNFDSKQKPFVDLVVADD